MAGFLWALSSVLDLDDLHILGPLSAPTNYSWLRDTLMIHECVMHAVLSLEKNRNACELALPIIAFGMDPNDWESICVSAACLGGLCEGLCVTRERKALSEIINLFRTAVGLCKNRDRIEQGVLGERLECSLAASIARVHKWIGSEIGYSATLFDYALKALLEFSFGIDELSRDMAMIGSFPSSSDNKSNMLLINSTWSMATMFAELVGSADSKAVLLALEKVAGFTKRFSGSFSIFMNRMRTDNGHWIPGESSGDTLRRAFLVVLALLAACFYKGSAEQKEMPRKNSSNDCSLLTQTRDFLRRKCSSLDQVNSKTVMVLWVLESLGNLHFCRVNDPQHIQLVEDALESLLEAESSQVLFTGLFPEQDSVMVPCSEKKHNSKLWKENALIVSKILFLMRLAPVGLGHSQHEENPANTERRSGRLVFCIEQLAPYSFLLLCHQDHAVRKSAHQFFHVLLMRLPNSKATEVSEKLTPYYIDCCLEQLNLLQPDEFCVCLRKLVSMLPITGISLKYCLEKLQSDAIDMFGDEQRGHGLILFEIICKCALWFPLSALNDNLQAVQAVIHFEGGQTTIPVLYKIVSTNKDYCRQVQLARFYLKIRHSMSRSKLVQHSSM